MQHNSINYSHNHNLYWLTSELQHLFSLLANTRCEPTKKKIYEEIIAIRNSYGN